jgi:hypothetical protein
MSAQDKASSLMTTRSLSVVVGAFKEMCLTLFNFKSTLNPRASLNITCLGPSLLVSSDPALLLALRKTILPLFTVWINYYPVCFTDVPLEDYAVDPVSIVVPDEPIVPEERVAHDAFLQLPASVVVEVPPSKAVEQLSTLDNTLSDNFPDAVSTGDDHPVTDIILPGETPVAADTADQSEPVDPSDKFWTYSDMLSMKQVSFLNIFYNVSLIFNIILFFHPRLTGRVNNR